MSRVIAALDNSLAANPVLMTAIALGRVLDAGVEAVHVRVNGDRVARSAAGAAQVPLRTASGLVVERLIEIGLASDVVALVVGARGSPLGQRPLGGTALAVATSLPKPLVVVPPEIRWPGQLRRVLVPLEGRETGSHTPRAIVELAQGEDLDVVVLHVLEEESLPRFTDQPQHEQTAQVEEFLRRYCPWGIGKVRLEVRVGRCDECVPVVAEEVDADIIALGWAQELEPGRAPVVRAALARGGIPVLLVPVNVLSEGVTVGSTSTRDRSADAA
jgi:nucleotide-binding universal stress UspA family protein